MLTKAGIQSTTQSVVLAILSYLHFACHAIMLQKCYATDVVLGQFKFEVQHLLKTGV
jgi:hypothetical protein